MATPVELVLTCGSWQEAQRIFDGLLERKLISGAEFLEADGIKLIMTTAEHLYEDLVTEVTKLHNGENLTLQRLPAKTA